MKRLATACMIALGLSASPSHAQDAQDAAKTAEYLSALTAATDRAMVYRSPEARRALGKLLVDCSLYGVEDRYIYADTLLRVAISILGSAAVKSGRAYYDIHETPTGLFVDSVLKGRDGQEFYREHTMVVDRSGRVVQLLLHRQAIGTACAGGLGPITLSASELRFD